MVELADVTWIRRLAANGGARAIREAAHLSVSEVARELGVSPASVSRWERGLRAPRGRVAERWAEILHKLA
jgi:transcriptional regulator with XRE-family HTH domain